MLHGEIKVNGDEVGDWSAIRREKNVVAQDFEHTYDCRVTIQRSYKVREFTVKHRYGDGAAALAQKVLSQAP